MKRPDGTTQSSFALLLAAIGFVSISVAFLVEPTSYLGEPAWEKMVIRFALFGLGGLCMQIALILAVASSIIRALWFLPGRGIESAPVPRPIEDAPNVLSPEAQESARISAIIVGVIIFLVLATAATFLVISARQNDKPNSASWQSEENIDAAVANLEAAARNLEGNK